MSITKKILISLIFGIILGSIINILFFNEVDSKFTNKIVYFFIEVCNLINNLYLNVLKMIAIPIVFSSLYIAIAELDKSSSISKLTLSTIFTYLGTTSIAIFLGLFIANLTNPGIGVEAQTNNNFEIIEAPSLVETFSNIIPSNFIAAFSSGNMLQIIFLSISLGYVSRLFIKNSESTLLKSLKEVNKVFIKLINLIIEISPLIIFFILVKSFSSLGFNLIYNLLNYFLTVIFVLIVHLIFTYGFLLVLIKENPIKLLSSIKKVLVFAFASSSSNATLPVTMETCKNELKIKPSIVSFVIPLGTTINMDGTAIMQGVATVFIAQMFGIDLGFIEYLLVIMTATLASIGTAGIPSVGLITLGLVLNQVGLPMEGVALILGIDRLLDMSRTAINVTGDIIVTKLIAKFN